MNLKNFIFCLIFVQVFSEYDREFHLYQEKVLKSMFHKFTDTDHLTINQYKQLLHHMIETSHEHYNDEMDYHPPIEDHEQNVLQIVINHFIEIKEKNGHHIFTINDVLQDIRENAFQNLVEQENQIKFNQLDYENEMDKLEYDEL